MDVVVIEVDGVDEVVVIEVAAAAGEVAEVCIRHIFFLGSTENLLPLHWTTISNGIVSCTAV